MLVLPLFAIVANWARLEIVRAVNEATGPTRVDLYSVPQLVKVQGVDICTDFAEMPLGFQFRVG